MGYNRYYRRAEDSISGFESTFRKNIGQYGHEIRPKVLIAKDLLDDKARQTD